MMNEAAITISNLNKEFKVGDEYLRVLNNVNGRISFGELTMLVGPSGCGKTTLISILSGILSPTSGEISVLSKMLTKLNDTEKVLFRRTTIGFIFQQYNLLPALTAAENAAIPLIAAGQSPKEASLKAAKVLCSLEMGSHTTKLPSQLSGGQQQRVAIARALIHDPQIIICDEPTAALDGKSGKAVMDILRTVANKKDRAVIVVTHDNRIYRYADTVLEMNDGKLIGTYPTAEFLQKHSV